MRPLTGDTSYQAPSAFGRFQVLHQIGAGVLGPVFLARDADRRSLAIKVFRIDITPEQAAELASQLGALSRVNLDHPSIAAPVTAGVEGTVAYLVQEYVGADSLDAAIRQYGPAPLGQALKILSNVAAALDFAAAVNVRHGALHPRDLLVTPDQVRVTGLGVAAALETIGLRAPVRRPYTAPERIQREAWDARADVFTLGVLAREMILGRGGRPDVESRLPEAVGARVQDIVSRATAARATERFATAFDLVRSLQDALTGGEAAPAKPAAARSLRAPRGRGLLLPLDEEVPPAEAAAEGAQAQRDLGPPPEPVPEPVPAVHEVPVSASVPAFPEIVVQPAAQEELASDFPLNLRGDMVGEELRAQTRDETVVLDEAVAPVAEENRFTDVLDAAAPETFAPVEPETEAVAPFAADNLDAPMREEGADDRAARKTESALAEEPRVAHRTGILPFAAVLVVGLVIGAIGGYYWGGSRNVETNTLPGVSQPAGPPAAGDSGRLTAAPSTPVQQPAAAPVASAAGQKSAGQPPPSPAAANPPVTKAAPANPPVTKPAPAAPAPAAANVKGRLMVRSTPGGAAVTVNGRKRGVTPLRLSNLSAGRYTVRLTRSGYAPEEREIVISSDRPFSTLSLTLRRAAAEPAGRAALVGSLAVDSTPPGAKVFVDGKLAGTTPCVVPDVAVGSHVVRVDLIGFRRWARSVQVKSGARIRVAAALERESQ